jgi:hypothetical protein
MLAPRPSRRKPQEQQREETWPIFNLSSDLLANTDSFAPATDRVKTL